MQNWSPSTWRRLEARQQPVYPDEQNLQEALTQLASYPSLVFSGEVDNLKQLLAEAAQGRRFMLLGGDCAERFIDCNNRAIANKLRILLQMSLVLTYGLRMPIVRIGRIAGQFAKPRSSDIEMIDGRQLPVYRGDVINSFEPDPLKRQPDPQRMLQTYFHSSTTINYIRALISGGFADLHHPEHWNLEFVAENELRQDYSLLVNRILDAIHFMDSMGGSRENVLGKIDFFTAHEGLLLCYEEALTRKSIEHDNFYNVGAHFLWIGDRTRQLDGAHVEYFRGLSNPIGVKIGPSCEVNELLEIIDKLNPDNEWGRLTLITRLGSEKVRELLPVFIDAVKQKDRRVLWCCDPMHGNTTITRDGVKTRNFNRVLSELRRSIEIHKRHKSVLGGVLFELTGDDVTECTGGAQNLGEGDLELNYQSYCDPRLNYAQSLEMAFQIAATEMA